MPSNRVITKVCDPKLVAGYVRVSTEEQAESGLGLATQKQDIERYCKDKGLTLVRIYSDEGISGKHEDRPALDELMKQAGKEFASIVIARFDRLARSLLVQLSFERDLKNIGCSIIAITEPAFEEEAERAMYRGIMGTFAQYDHAKIVQKLKSGRAYKRNQGGYAGGEVPLGFTRSLHSKIMTPDHSKASNIRHVFDLYSQGLSLTAIALECHKNGICGGRGGKLYASTIKSILAHEGLYRANGLL
jgi:DNA invertase Pin-like site-specific DNA recombinase